MLVTTDDGLKSYLTQVLSQLSGNYPALCCSPCAACSCPLLLLDWLVKGEVQKLVIVINGVTTGDVLERWVFNVETDRDSVVG
jgi:mitotic spindle assembly checkpoint protein MAD2